MKNKFELFEINSIIYFIMRASFIGIIINNIVDIAKNDSYLCPILGTIIGIIIVILYVKIANIDKDKNINENILAIFGNNVGKFIIILLSLFMMSLGVILTYNIINFIISEYLYLTPNYAIMAVLIVPIIYLLKGGIKVIGRVSIILFFTTFILYILSIFGLFGQMDFDKLLPFMANGINPIIKGTLIYTAYTVLPIFLITIIPKGSIKNYGDYDKKVIKYYLLLSMIQVISEIILITVLGPDLATLYKYPSYHMLSKITIGGFIKRIESLLAIQWIICIYFMLVFINYYIIDSLKHVFNVKSSKYLNYVIPIIMLIIGNSIFKNNASSLTFEIDFYPYLLFVFLLIIPLIIYLFSLKKKTR